jgi:riboflavin synthase
VFSGIVRERGRVVSTEPADGGQGRRLLIEAGVTAATTQPGDSVSIAGCCLTATAVLDGRMAFDAVPETVARSTLGRLQEGAEVNVEPALRVGEPLGGHFVQGHVDGVGRVRSMEPEGDGARLWLDVEPELLRYCVEKGSIAVDGVSLTIAALDERGVAVALVPHTLRVTTLGALRPGEPVNLELDLLAKYAERLARR